MSTSVARPRKKTAVSTYTDVHKTTLKATFEPLWASIKDSMKPNERLQMWNEHVRVCWEKETFEVRSNMMKRTDEENETAMAEWKKKALFTGSPEDLDQ